MKTSGVLLLLALWACGRAPTPAEDARAAAALAEEAAQVEAACGFAPGDLLRVLSPRLVEVSARETEKVNFARFACVMQKLDPWSRRGVQVAIVGEDAPE